MNHLEVSAFSADAGDVLEAGGRVLMKLAMSGKYQMYVVPRCAHSKKDDPVLDIA